MAILRASINLTGRLQVEAGSIEHPSESTNEAAEDARPEAGWVASLLEWGAVPPLISLMSWPDQADTTPWPGAYAAAGKSHAGATGQTSFVQLHRAGGCCMRGPQPVLECKY